MSEESKQIDCVLCALACTESFCIIFSQKVHLKREDTNKNIEKKSGIAYGLECESNIVEIQFGVTISGGHYGFVSKSICNFSLDLHLVTM